jgi:hypothetical protein
MSEAELWHLYLLAVENCGDAMTALLTIVSGYLVASYVVGSRLRPHQAITVSILFVLGAGVAEISAFVQLKRAYYFLDRLKAQFGVQSFVPTTPVLYFTVAVMCLLIPAALYFMWHIRRNPTLGERST